MLTQKEEDVLGKQNHVADQHQLNWLSAASHLSKKQTTRQACQAAYALTRTGTTLFKRHFCSDVHRELIRGHHTTLWLPR